MTFLEWMQLFTVVAAGVGGVGYLFKVLRKAFRAFESMYRLVMHELQPNSGSSLVDQVRKNAMATELLVQRFDTHLEWSAAHNEAVATAMQDIAEAVSNGDPVRVIELPPPPVR